MERGHGGSAGVHVLLCPDVRRGGDQVTDLGEFLTILGDHFGGFGIIILDYIIQILCYY